MLGGDACAQGVGAGLGGAAEPDHALLEGGVAGGAAGGRVRARSVPGGRQPRPQDVQADREQAQGVVRADARHLHLRHQHHRRQGPPPLRVPHLPQTLPHRPQVRRIRRLRDGQQPQALDPPRRRAPLRHQVDTEKRIIIALYSY